ncbi:MAG: hypothetical protein QM790_18960 [Nibricoccus sp.]
MKTILASVMSLIGFVASVAVASAVDESASRITTSRSLSIASVRLDSDAPWYVLQEAFSTSLQKSLGERGGVMMPIKMLSKDSSAAADALLNGECDAVLVIGEQLPAAFKGGKFFTLRAVSQIGVPAHVFHFILRNDDSSAKSVLTVAFERATSSAAFQDTVGRASAVRVVAGNMR